MTDACRTRTVRLLACGMMVWGCGSEEPAGDASAGRTSVSWGGTAGEANGGASAGDSGAATGGTATAGASGHAATFGGAGSGLPRACSAEEAPRTVRVRLEVPEGVQEPTASNVPSSDLGAEFLVDGTLAAVTRTEDCDGCSDAEGTISIEIEEMAGERSWTLAAGPLALVEEWETLANALVGEEVQLRYRYRRLFQAVLSEGFTLEDELGVVLAADLGPHVQTLDAAALRGFGVTPGADRCVAGSSCDRWVYQDLVFSGDTTAAVGLAEVGTFAIGDRTYGARNSGAGRSIGSCLDYERASPWSVWRRLEP